MGERVGSEYSFDLGTVQSHHSERERNVIHAELQSGVVRDNSGDCADCVFVFRYGYSVNPTDLIADLEENHKDWNVLRGHRTSLLEYACYRISVTISQVWTFLN